MGPPDELLEARWVEVQFYIICHDIYSLRHNMLDVLDFIQYLCLWGTFDVESIQHLAQEILVTQRIIPSKQEMCILFHEHNMSIKEILRRTGHCKAVIYRMFRAHERDPLYFYPKLSASITPTLQEFLKIFAKFKQIGVSL